MTAHGQTAKTDAIKVRASTYSRKVEGGEEYQLLVLLSLVVHEVYRNYQQNLMFNLHLPSDSALTRRTIPFKRST